MSTEQQTRDQAAEQAQCPRAVTILSTILIIFSAIGFVATFIVLASTHAETILLVLAVPSAVQLIAALGLRRGRNWGRMLYICFIPIVVCLNVANENVKLGTILAALLYIMFTPYLSTPKVVAYFKRPKKTTQIGNSVTP